jgi:hypothetical protein
VRDGACGERVDISDLPIFQPESMTIGQSVLRTEICQSDDCSHIDIDDEAPVDELDRAFQWQASCTGGIGIPLWIRVGPALEPRRECPRAPWQTDAKIHRSKHSRLGSGFPCPCALQRTDAGRISANSWNRASNLMEDSAPFFCYPCWISDKGNCISFPICSEQYPRVLSGARQYGRMPIVIITGT